MCLLCACLCCMTSHIRYLPIPPAAACTWPPCFFANAAPVGPNAGRYNPAGSWCGPLRTGAGPACDKTLWITSRPVQPQPQSWVNMAPPMGQMGPLMGKMNLSLLVSWHALCVCLSLGPPVVCRAALVWCFWADESSDQRLVHCQAWAGLWWRVPGQPLSGRA